MADQTIEALQSYAGQLSEAAAQAKAAANIQHQIVHGGAAVDVLTEGGLVPSLAKQVVLAQDKVNGVLENVATQLAGAAIVTTVAQGLVATVNGGYFSVVSPIDTEYVILYRNESGVAVPKKRYSSAEIDSLTVNRGKIFPLNALKPRAGVISTDYEPFRNVFLDAEIINAESTKLYRVPYIASRTGVDGATILGFRVEEYDKATYETVGTPVIIHNFDVNAASVYRSRGAQNIVFECTSRPGLFVRLVIDAASIPADGVFFSSVNPGFPGLNWYVDESCYTIKRGSNNSLTINRGEVFPLNALKPRAGVISADFGAFRDVFLDAEVINADAASLYRVSYVAARASPTAGVSYLGFRIEKFVKADYETVGIPVIVHNFESNVATIIRAGGPQNIVFECESFPGLFIRLVIDAAKLPADGAYFTSVNPNFPGLNWYIDESCYTIQHAAVAAANKGVMGVYYEYKHDLKELSFAYASGNWAYRVFMKAAGAINQLFDIQTIQRAPLVGDLANAVWQAIPGASGILTDYFPPMVVRAVNNADPGATQIYTGGSHGSDGAGGGQPTAKLFTLALFGDGAILDKDSAGYANTLSLMMVNRLMGWNTWAAGRYIVQQHFAVDVTPHGMDINARITALEDIVVSTDNGPQCYFGGFNDTQMIPDGMEPTRVPLDSTKLSGNKIDYPNVWIVLMRSAYGTQAAWVDRTFEAGDGRYVSNTANFIRGGGGAKFYNAIVAAFSHVMDKGQSYRWRGGFHFMSNTNKDGFDTRANIRVGGKTRSVAVTTGGESFFN